MLKKLFQTKNDTAIFILRLLLGGVFFPHGMQKAFGWFGGSGFEGAMQSFQQGLGIPGFFAVLAILAESAGSIGLITGFLTRVAAFGITVNMVVAVALIHWKYGFFMNWFGKQAGEGFEYHILVVAITTFLMIRGGGRWSIDGSIYRKLGGESGPQA
ncbi:MAG: DoxX family protein [Candidatus Sulfobium sp.]